MTQPETKFPTVYLKPGELCFSREAATVSTVLGSCVAVTLFSPRYSVGAICHAMLPYSRGEKGFKYVDCSIRYMLERFHRSGIRLSEIEAKLFGGADMFPPSKDHPQVATVGGQNVLAALDYLDNAGVRLTAKDVRGSRGRKVVFHCQSGEVFLKRVQKHGGLS